jgi:predicted metalloprotease with PDZ domain
MQLRSGLIDIERYMRIISNKLRMNDYFDQNISLKEMALTSYSESGYGSFMNFYEKGAVTAVLLDLKILELSDGKKGLREVFLNLLKIYGKNRPFPEDNFYNIFVNETYPEIQSFFERYIVGIEPLPFEEYFAKLGYKYIPRRVADGERPSLGTNISMNENMEIITIDVHEQAKEWGLEEGDIIIELLGKNVSMETIRDIVTEAMAKKIGDPLTMKVKRDGTIISINGEFLQMIEKHVFVEMDSLTEEQINFRKIWSRNL